METRSQRREREADLRQARAAHATWTRQHAEPGSLTAPVAGVTERYKDIVVDGERLWVGSPSNSHPVATLNARVLTAGNAYYRPSLRIGWFCFGRQVDRRSATLVIVGQGVRVTRRVNPNQLYKAQSFAALINSR